MKNVRQLLLGMLVCISYMSFSQMGYFTLFPNYVDVNSSTIVSDTINGLGTDYNNYRTGNAVYDVDGNVLFSIKEREIHDVDGVGIHTLPGYTNPYVHPSTGQYELEIANEISIVPIPNECRQYLVVYTMYSLMGSALLHVKIDASTSTISMTNLGMLHTSGGQGVGLAVSRVFGSNQRYVYYRTNSPSEVRRYIINANGTISFDRVLLNSGISTFSSCEMDLTPDGTVLYWGNENTFYYVEDAHTTSPTVNTFNSFPVGVTAIQGVEYTLDNSDDPYFIIATNSGLYKKDYTSSTLTTISSGTFNTELERAVNGKVYGVNSSAKLFEINTALTSISATLIHVNSDGMFPFVFTLNDQIDGESYYNFNGVDLLAFGDMFIDSEDVSTSSPYTPIAVYNCVDVELISNILGVDQYRLKVYDHTDINGDYTSTGTLVNETGWVYSALPSALNLLDLPGTGGDWLANNHGYVRIELEIAACGSVTTDFYLKLNTVPTVNLSLNFDSQVYAPDKTVPGVSQARISPNYNLHNSSGNIEFHTIEIDLVDANGDYVENIISYMEIPLTGGLSSLNATNCNIYVSNPFPARGWSGGPVYFAMPPLGASQIGDIYKLTAGVGNVCGVSTDYTYFTLIQDVGKVSDGFLYDEYNVVNSEIYPNPFTDYLFVNISEEEIIENVFLSDMAGKEIHTSYRIEKTNDAIHTLTIDTQALPSGIYLYAIKTQIELYQGKVVKN